MVRRERGRNEGVQGWLRREARESRRRFAEACTLRGGNGRRYRHILSSFVRSATLLSDASHPCMRTGYAAADGDGCTGAVTTVMAVSSRVDGLDNLLRICATVWPYFCSLGRGGRAEGSGRRVKYLEIGSFGNCGVLKYDVQTSVVDPFNFEATLDVLPI